MTTSRIRTAADQLKSLGLPVKADDQQPRQLSEELRQIMGADRFNQVNQEMLTPLPTQMGPTGRPQPGPAPSTARQYPTSCDVLFRVPNVMEFELSFLAAVLSECRSYLVLSLPDSAAGRFRMAGSAEHPIQVEVLVASIGLLAVVQNSEKAISYVIDGLKFYLFPIVDDRSHLLRPPPAPEPAAPVEDQDDEDETEEPTEEDVSDDEATGYDNPVLRGILGIESPRGDQ